MYVEIHKSNEQISNSEDEAFNTIYLNINHRDIYQAWDEFMINRLEDFKNSEVKSLF